MRLLHEATEMSRLSACSFYASKYFQSVRMTLDLVNHRLSRDHVRLHAVNHENRTLHEPHHRGQVHSSLFYPHDPSGNISTANFAAVCTQMGAPLP